MKSSYLNTHSMLRLLLFTCINLLFATSLVAQFDGPPNTLEEYQEQYNWRITQEKLNGVYIPANLDEAIAELDRLTDEDSRKKFAQLPEDQAYRRLYHSLRLWVINNWGLNGGSRLGYLFHDFGLKHPDDLAELIIISWHRHLNQKELDLKSTIERILEARTAIWKASKERSSITETDKG